MKIQNAIDMEKFLKLVLAREFRTHAPGTGKIAQFSAPVVCGTGFSSEAIKVAEGAAVLARHLGERVVLVHAIDERPQHSLPENSREALAHIERERLHSLRERICQQSGNMVETSLHSGQHHVALLEEAVTHRARLLVVPGPARPSIFRTLAGNVPEQVAESAHVPTLVVRDSASLLQWAGGGRRIRILVGVDGSPASTAALDWVDWFRKIWPCELIVTCLETRPPAIQGRETLPSLFMGEMVLKTAHTQERHFREQIRARFGEADVQARYEKAWARCDQHLIQLAREERADLIVVGTHSRSGWARLLHHSVSRGVLREASCNVVCVPEPNRETSQLVSHFACNPCVSPAHEN
jgi:nucleotide-binding universal stress UspA family protein